MDVKRILACAALLAGLLFFNGRLSAAVESDIVGYTTVSLAPGNNMVNPCFESLEEGKKLSLGEFVNEETEGLIASASSTSSTKVMYWNGTEYETAFLYKKRGSSSAPVWMDSATSQPSTLQLVPGEAVWLVQPKTATQVEISLKGKVPNDVSVSHVIRPGLNMIGSGFTQGWDLNNCGIDWQAVAKAGTSSTNADQVQMWNAATSTYDTYFFFKGRGTSELDYKWVNKDKELAPEIPVGSGVWYVSRGENEFSFSEFRPYNF